MAVNYTAAVFQYLTWCSLVDEQKYFGENFCPFLKSKRGPVHWRFIREFPKRW